MNSTYSQKIIKYKAKITVSPQGQVNRWLEQNIVFASKNLMYRRMKHHLSMRNRGFSLTINVTEIINQGYKFL